MPLNRMFDLIEEAKATANWKAAFGEPQHVEDKTLIPVARVGYAFGLGFGQAPGSAEAEAAPESSTSEGGGGGGGASSKPLGAIVVTPDRVYFQSVDDPTRVTVTGMLVGALFLWQLAKTVRALAGRG